MPRTIPLHGKHGLGRLAVVDDEDYERMARHRWFGWPNRNGSLRAARKVDGRVVLMHQEVAGVVDGQLVDHRDGDGLNNTRSNLRHCTQAANARNRRKHRHAHYSEFKGVGWDGSHRRWRARINIGGRQVTLGRFDDQVSAASAYDRAALQHFGEFARLNFPVSL